MEAIIHLNIIQAVIWTLGITALALLCFAAGYHKGKDEQNPFKKR
jgi:hypothetical protein